MKQTLFLLILFIFLVSCQRDVQHPDSQTTVPQQNHQEEAVNTQPAQPGNVSEGVDADIASIDQMDNDLGVMSNEDDVDLNFSSFDDW